MNALLAPFVMSALCAVIVFCLYLLALALVDAWTYWRTMRPHKFPPPQPMRANVCDKEV